MSIEDPISIQMARNPLTSLTVLDDLASRDPLDLSLVEALLLNQSLGSDTLSRMIRRCPINLSILALNHPHLLSDDQMYIISGISDNKIRTKAHLILLERNDLSEGILASLCLDPKAEVRAKATEVLKKYDSNNSRSK